MYVVMMGEPDSALFWWPTEVDITERKIALPSGTVKMAHVNDVREKDTVTLEVLCHSPPAPKKYVFLAAATAAERDAWASAIRHYLNAHRQHNPVARDFPSRFVCELLHLLIILSI